MKVTTFYNSFPLNSTDSTSLHGHCWLPTNPPKALIIIVHGLGGHGLRYSNWAEQFCEFGYCVYSVDLRGHGQSDGKQGHANNLQEYVADIQALVNFVDNNEHKNLPKFIYGNSLGGLLASMLVTKFPQSFKGVILAAPWFKLTNPPSSFSMIALKILVHIMPKYSVKTGVSSSQLRSSKKEQDIAKVDPYIHKLISLSLFNNITEVTKMYQNKIPQMQIPIFAIHGKNDQVTSAKQTRHFMAQQKGPTELLLLNNNYHEIHLEEEGKLAIHKINSWIKNNR